MPALFFPNLTALRLALASGLVPAAIARAPAAAGFDAQGRLWLELAELPPRDALAALARVGVKAQGAAGVPTEPVRCWAELLPLVRSNEPPAGPVLFVVPDRNLAKFVARLRRSTHSTVGVTLRDAANEPHGWVTAYHPSSLLLAETREPGATISAFVEQSPSVWVRHGWRHPLPEWLTIPPHHLLLVRPPRSVIAVSGAVPTPAADDLPLPEVRSHKPVASLAPNVSVRLTLASRRPAEREVLWVLDAERAGEFWAFCAAADERLIRRLSACLATSGTAARLVVRAVGKHAPLILPHPLTGYAADPRVPGLFVPADQMLRPTLRARELARALGVAPDRLVWVEPGPNGGVVAHSVAVSAFRPLAELMEYTAPAMNSLTVRPREEPFPLLKIPTPIEHQPGPEPERAPPSTRDSRGKNRNGEPEITATGPGWVRRSLQKLAARLRPAREPLPPPPPPPTDHPRPTTAPSGRRAERKLASPDALQYGHDWTARRRELEGRLFRELPTLGPEGRAARWADLAVVYATTGNPADASVCWMNGLWESPTPPAEWLHHWFAAECRAAKLTDTAGGLDRWLSEPGRPGVGRVVAAYTALAGFATNTPPEFLSALPRILVFLDQHFDDLPVRAAWLARLAATRLCDGDALGLARWRDRVLARLADRGPGLDLDEPSFLRFHGTASADRFQAARKWLEQAHKPAIDWIGKHAGGNLQRAGLDAEIECTTAYARFMFAWGLGCLGERTLAKDWAARARKELARRTGPRYDPAGHAVLGDLFLHRVKDAREGRPPKPVLPTELQARIDGLSLLARFAVNRLRQHSRILEPLDRVRAYGGLELKHFWSNDRLGERLSVLAGGSDATQQGDEASALLQLCAATPTTDTVPRIVLTLLEIAPRLAPPVLLRVLDLVPTAVEWVEAWLAQGRWTEDERPRRLAYYQARMIEAAFAAAAGHAPADVGTAVAQLARRLVASGEMIRAPLLSAAASVFRCLRRLALPGEAEMLMRFLDPSELGPADSPIAPPAARLGLAVGWFTAGNEDTGYRILDDARERLYRAGDGESSDRTELAIAYAGALGFAPPRIAHGRLAEIFQQLGRVKVDGGTNQYFTLKPLQLIDTVVRSVVTDEFTLGPTVRGWLDDDEFLIRGRIHRDLALVLREQGMG